MALTGKFSNKEGADAQEIFSVKFTNGTLAQLREIHTFLKQKKLVNGDDLTDVVKVGISILVGAKEAKDASEE